MDMKEFMKRMNPNRFACQYGEFKKVGIKIAHDENGKVVAVDTETGQSEEIRTMENLLSEVEERRKLREKAKKMMEESILRNR